jgi:hypothetical protein
VALNPPGIRAWRRDGSLRRNYRRSGLRCSLGKDVPSDGKTAERNGERQ